MRPDLRPLEDHRRRPRSRPRIRARWTSRDCAQAARCSTRPSTADRCPDSADRCRRRVRRRESRRSTAWQTTSASECPSAPRSDGTVDAAEYQRPAFDQAVQIVADADASDTAPLTRFAARAPLEVSGGRDLHVRRVAHRRRGRMAGALRQHRFVGRRSPTGAASGDAAPSTSRRNACGVCARKIVSRGSVSAITPPSRIRHGRRA